MNMLEPTHLTAEQTALNFARVDVASALAILTAMAERSAARRSQARRAT
jgi:hypothetical protein